MTRTSTMPSLPWLSALALPLLLAACGFHLRAPLQLPADLGPLRVVSRDPYSPLAQSLSEAMTRAGAVPAPEPVIVAPPTDGSTAAAPEPPAPVATLRVVSERWGSKPLSVNQRGRAQEYSLRYAVVFQLTGADGRELVPRQVIELSRDYISVPNNSSGTEGEREILSKEMHRDMVVAILRRIDAALSAPRTPVEPSTTPSTDGTGTEATTPLPSAPDASAPDEPAAVPPPAAEPPSTP
ncbi:LPS assembly lipoprotein LptE [Cognatiluteimonas telluris]|jgi:LPS-assembly lipoprotein|uniref:LPS-assembly lipoprotein LptE n=1 Tax=Cognatiluteimonas telluris TaxID=1104775 RepID=UPI001FB028EA|nr:LPS assembly lipoprotein LptE [Lysobacter telluris]